jgi:hypothetical protein
MTCFFFLFIKHEGWCGASSIWVGWGDGGGGVDDVRQEL